MNRTLPSLHGVPFEFSPRVYKSSLSLIERMKIFSHRDLFEFKELGF